MAKVCDMCGKTTIFGHNIQHKGKKSKWRYKAPRTNRKFKPNLKKHKIYDEDGNYVETISICMKCYKRMRKEQEEE